MTLYSRHAYKSNAAYRRPTTLQDRTRDSDEEDRDYDVAALANNLSQAFNYRTYGNDDNEEVFFWLLVLHFFPMIYSRHQTNPFVFSVFRTKILVTETIL